MMDSMLAQLRGGQELFNANSDTELLDQMRKSSFDRGVDLQEYMDLYAKRLRQWDGTAVNTTSPGAFIQDLKRIGELRTWQDVATAG
jgi:hypothetical protein